MHTNVSKNYGPLKKANKTHTTEEGRIDILSILVNTFLMK